MDTYADFNVTLRKAPRSSKVWGIFGYAELMYCNPSADGEYITIGWEDYGKKGCDYEVKLTMSDLLYLVARLGTRGNKVAKAVYSGLGLGNVV